MSVGVVAPPVLPRPPNSTSYRSRWLRTISSRKAEGRKPEVNVPIREPDLIGILDEVQVGEEQSEIWH